MKVQNIDEVIEALRYECFKEKGQKNFAKKHSISQSTLSAALNGKRMPTDDLIKLAGYELKYVKAVG
ncbi:MAG TPA: helix-turn-helix transcriptional regulator [Niabella sp.]|nr:helix-turn-helix transcriptional regulator [Niabella sp.]